jgi:mono/diheme cytochrome c family protein
MEMRTRFGVLAAALSLAAAAPAAAQDAKLPAGVTPAMVAKGKTVFTSSGLCFACHGMDGNGAVGPNLTDSTWIQVKSGDYAGLVTLITKGVSAAEAKTGKGPMAPKGGSTISDDDVKAVAAYVWTLSHGG